MKKVEVVVAGKFLVSILFLVIGARRQLGLHVNEAVLEVAYGGMLMYGVATAFAVATLIGDAVAKRWWKYKPVDNRWTYWAAGDSHTQQGAGFRVLIHAILQAPIIFFVAEFFFG